jgi:hypothetical protein
MICAKLEQMAVRKRKEDAPGTGDVHVIPCHRARRRTRAQRMYSAGASVANHARASTRRTDRGDEKDTESPPRLGERWPGRGRARRESAGGVGSAADCRAGHEDCRVIRSRHARNPRGLLDWTRLERMVPRSWSSGGVWRGEEEENML